MRVLEVLWPHALSLVSEVALRDVLPQSLRAMVIENLKSFTSGKCQDQPTCHYRAQETKEV
jgi:hypothetical protein